MSKIAIIDYGMGNLHSIAKALEHVAGKQRVIVSGDHGRILAADRVVFPGVGAIRDCMAELERSGLDTVVKKAAANKPLLGVCLGMQALLDHSEENQGTDCLGLIPGNVRHFPGSDPDNSEGERLKIPHMGWNQVHQETEHPMWDGIAQDARFYFVHSYFAQPGHPDLIEASTAYGFPFTSAVSKDNVFAVQFHPEKSQHAGLDLYANFLKWDGKANHSS